MPTRFRKTCTSALALFMGLWLSGGHWMVLQVTAWSGMVVSRTVEMGVSEALESTFNGEHPCAMCRAVQAGQEQENSNLPKPVKEMGKLKLDVTLSVGNMRVTPPPPLALTSWRESSLAVVSQQPEPPVPPPRTAA